VKRLPSLWIFDWRKVLAYTHRWLGIAGCVLFIAWFISGVVMMYARMPGLANEERLARAPALDLSAVAISPAEAAGRTGAEVDRVQVGMLQGRPASPSMTRRRPTSTCRRSRVALPCVRRAGSASGAIWDRLPLGLLHPAPA